MRRTPWRLVAAGLATCCAVALGQPVAAAATTATIDGSAVFQPIDGFGRSEAFGRTSVIRAMSAANQQQVLDLIFNRTPVRG